MQFIYRLAHKLGVYFSFSKKGFICLGSNVIQFEFSALVSGFSSSSNSNQLSLPCLGNQPEPTTGHSHSSQVFFGCLFFPLQNVSKNFVLFEISFLVHFLFKICHSIRKCFAIHHCFNFFCYFFLFICTIMAFSKN